MISMVFNSSSWYLFSYTSFALNNGADCKKLPDRRKKSLLQRFDGTDFLAFLAEDAFGGVLAVAGVAVHLDVHRTNLKAFSALDTLALVAAHTQQRVVAHGLQEDRDGTDVFAEGAVVFQHQGENDADHIIEHVSSHEKVEQGGLVSLTEGDKQDDHPEREGEHDVTYEANAASRPGGLLVRQQVEDHGRPAGIATPSAAEEQWAEDLGDGVVQHAGSHHPREEVVPEALQLHILTAYQAQEDKDIGTYGKLHELARILPSRCQQGRADAQTASDIGEVEQEEQVARGQPQRHRDGLKNGEQDDGRFIFSHSIRILCFSLYFLKTSTKMVAFMV